MAFNQASCTDDQNQEADRKGGASFMTMSMAECILAAQSLSHPSKAEK